MQSWTFSESPRLGANPPLLGSLDKQRRRWEEGAEAAPPLLYKPQGTCSSTAAGHAGPFCPPGASVLARTAVLVTTRVGGGRRRI